MNEIENFLKYFSLKTQATYKSCLNRFFKAIKANPETYFDDERDYKVDITEFWLSMKGKPPKTIKTNLAAVKSFLMEYEIEMSNGFWKKLSKRTKGSRAVMIDNPLGNYQLKEILQHGETKARALFLIVSSSGMRISEVLQLTKKDIDMESKPVKINIRRETTKTGNPRISFISDEAKEALNAWLKERDKYLESAIKKSNFKNKKNADDSRIFPFKYNVARVMWNRLIEKAGYDEIDERTGRHKMHIHTLRRYFRTRMALEIPADVVETLMGHEEYLTQVYRKYQQDDLARMYLKGEEKVVVFETPIDNTAIEEQLGKLRLENLQLRKDLDKAIGMIERETSPKIDSVTREKFGYDERYILNEEDNTIQEMRFNREKRDFVPVGEKMDYDEWEKERERKFREEHTPD